jgi:hypothetical protein
MHSPEDALRKLADQLSWTGSSTGYPNREVLEASLLPLIRCALRTGRGLPPLVRWLKAQLPSPASPHRPGQPLGPEWAAPSMARLLCATLLERLQGPAPPGQQVLETVAGL